MANRVYPIRTVRGALMITLLDNPRIKSNPIMDKIKIVGIYFSNLLLCFRIATARIPPTSKVSNLANVKVKANGVSGFKFLITRLSTIPAKAIRKTFLLEAIQMTNGQNR